MWLSADGNFNTVALQDPTHVMTKEFHDSLLRLADSSAEDLTGLIDDQEELVLDTDLANIRTVEQRFEGQPPPAGLLTGTLTKVSDLQDRLTAVDDRWRLDAIVAVTDVIDTA